MKKIFKNYPTVYAPIIASYLLITSYIPQLWMTFKTKDSSGHSVVFWFSLNVAILHMVINQLHLSKKTNSRGGLYIQLVNLTLALIMFILVLIYK